MPRANGERRRDLTRPAAPATGAGRSAASGAEAPQAPTLNPRPPDPRRTAGSGSSAKLTAELTTPCLARLSGATVIGPRHARRRQVPRRGPVDDWRRTRAAAAGGQCHGSGVRWEPMRNAPRVGYEPAAAVAVNVNHVLALLGDPLARYVPLLRVLVMPAHGRVRLHLGVPPRGDDPALQRPMRYRDETIGRGDVREQAFHSMRALR